MKIAKWLILASWLPAVVLAQSFTATIRGVVTDSARAVVPGARVAVVNVERNTKQNSETDAAGRYVITELPPGKYRLEVEAVGFSAFAQGPFELEVNQQATLNVELKLGTVETKVEVTGAAPMLNVTSAALGQVVENKFIQSLPSLNRSAVSLVALAPGIGPSDVEPGTIGSGDPTNFVANGVRNSTSDVMLDGVTVTNVEQHSGITALIFQPPIDSIQEFKVQSNFYSAEYGNSGGAVINMVTKSGTNDLHGVVYELHQDVALNANDWFANSQGQTSVPDAHTNIFGGGGGGPVYLPKLYNGKNRTFYFMNFESQRAATATTQFATIPSPLEQAGDFSQTKDAQGRAITIFNPFSTTASGGRTLRNPFPGNVIPASMLDPIARKVIGYYPKATSDGRQFTHANNFFAQGTNANTNTFLDAKIDHNISSKQRLSSRYSFDLIHVNNADLWGNQANSFINGKTNQDRIQNFVLDFTRSQSPTTVITLRAGVTREHSHRDPPGLGFDPTTLGLPQILQTSGILLFPNFAPAGYTAVGTNGNAVIRRADDITNLNGSLTKIMGGHTLKTGSEARLMRLNYAQPAFPAGGFSFSAAITQQDPNLTNSLQGNGLASMLLGWGTGGNYSITPPSASASQYYGWYVQDDWRISQRLTLNLGLRYDIEVPRTERYNRYTWFNFNEPSPIAGKVPGYPNLMGAFHVADSNTRSPVDGDYNNVQPRIGFAYALGSKMSFRGGYGIFYTMSRANIKGGTGQGFATTTTPEFSRDANLTQYATLENPFPNGLIQFPALTQGASAFLGLAPNTETRPNQSPMYQSWNLSVQRQLPANSIFEANYTGSKGNHLYFGGMENQDLLNPVYWGLGRTALNASVPNPFYGVITDPQSPLSAPTVTRNIILRPYPQYNSSVTGSPPGIGNSVYHALQLKYEKRTSHGLTVVAHYTFSKMIDDSSYDNGGVGFLGGSSAIQSKFNLHLERSLSVLDVPHRAVFTFAWQLPVGRGKALGGQMNRFANALVGGWEANGLVTFSSGFPIVPSLTGAQLWDATQRPNLVGDPSTSGSIESRLNHYFNTDAFSKPAPDALGTAPRTLSYRSPGFHNADMAMLKNFGFTESKRLQLRLEAINFTNSVNFGKPNASYLANGFGIINGYAGGYGPRQVQVGLKFYY
jgi:hypothetical protein